MNKYIEDIEFLINKLEEIHPNLYFNDKQKEIQNMIEELKTKKEISYYEFLYFLKSIFKLINDPHTILLNKTITFPIKLKMIDNKLYIIETSKEYEDYKYSEIISINDIPIEMLIREIEKITQYTTKEWLEAQIEVFLKCKTNINYLPFFKEKSLEKITYKVKKDSSEKEFTFIKGDEYNNYYIDNRLYWIDYDNTNNILIINYKNCKEDPNYSMEKFINDIDLKVQEYDIKNIIIDIRGNKGGDSRVIGPLIDYLDNDFNLATIVDKYVFSSGRFALLNLINLDSKIIGTNIGTTINAYGNVENFRLPNTNLSICCSNTYWYLNNRRMCGLKKEDINKELDKTIFENCEFILDVYVENTIEDYKNGYDRQLETAKEILKSKVKL